MNTAYSAAYHPPKPACIFVACVVFASVTLFCITGRALANGRQAFILDMSFRQLMLDDFVVFEARGANKVYPVPEKLGKPVLEATFPYEKEQHILSEPHVFYDPVERRYRMWYWTTIRDRRPPGSWKTPLCYAESDDGLNWTKPKLGHVEYQGDKAENNIVSDVLFGPTMVPLAKPGEFRFCFIGHHQHQAALSRDGRTLDVFKPFNMGLIPNQQASYRKRGAFISDCYRYMYDPLTGKYRGAVRTWATLAGSAVPNQFRRALALATSDDLEHWTFTERLLECDLADDAFVESLPTRQRKDLPAFAEIEQMTHFRYEGLILGFPNLLYFYDTHLSGWNSGPHLWWSFDGANWSKPAKRYQFIPGPVGTPYWGFFKGIGPLPPLLKGNELWFYHAASEGHINERYNAPRQQWITLSKLRVDGWAAYEAGAEGGWVDTQRFVADGILRINADCAAGELRVEVFEVAGDKKTAAHLLKNTLIPGFSKDDCAPITGDVYEQQVGWKEKAWSELKGKTVKLRIHLKNAKIYSFWTKAENDIIGVQHVPSL